MKVKDLIELLQKEDQESIVIMSDPECNNYSPCGSIYSASYLADTLWSGQIGLLELTEELESQGYTEEDVLKDGIKSIVLTSLG